MYFAHSENKIGEKEVVIEHLLEVTKLCKEFSNQWGKGTEGEVAGLYHDLGKYTEAFQQVLIGACKVDHATPGAAAALFKYKLKGVAAALSIQGHHDGLQYGSIDTLVSDLKMKNTRSRAGKTYSTVDFSKLIEYLVYDYGNLPSYEDLESDYYDLYKKTYYIDAMLYVRMLFSALVDADYLATEAHFQGDENGKVYRDVAPLLNPDKALDMLFAYKRGLERESKADSKINRIRKELFDVCFNAGFFDKGIYTLTAPTGSGKTLAMMGFALNHAKVNKLRRIIIVLPFCNIIDQTAKTYKNIFDEIDQPSIILEDHSLVDYGADGDGERRLFSENWDSPIIITTTVKFFESLFSNQPSACRKLHNISNSIVIFDEAQTMPANLTLATLNALAVLNARFGCSIVFSTATQPAYEHLNDLIRDKTETQWAPKEIVPSELKLFERSKRVTTIWVDESMSLDSVADTIAIHDKILVIVNLRRHAKTLFDLVNDNSGSTYHISTNMCPSHRLDVLNEINRRLKNDLPCKVISTQCIEAGVDIDFPVVWRAMAPLDAIVQAAGRCNRNGRTDGQVYIFTPNNEEEKYPGNEYKWGAITVKSILRQKAIELWDTGIIKEYYKRYFDSINISDVNQQLYDAIKRLDFIDTARHYRWIPKRGINILVPYKNKIDLFNQLKEEAFENGFSKKWARNAREICVSIMVHDNSPIHDYITEVMVMKRGKAVERSGYYVLLNSDLYNSHSGLDLTAEGGEDFYMA
ncbi:MAG: CRISPR-associated helicase Cas3' [Clostridia bacterium]|nr:CRISPR-associated helicase Cas3' [Clostridia bacterium]